MSVVAIQALLIIFTKLSMFVTLGVVYSDRELMISNRCFAKRWEGEFRELVINLCGM